MLKVLFIDRDGTLIEEPADEQVDALHKVRLMPCVISALQDLRDHGYRFVMVSNQDGLGTPSFPHADFSVCHDYALELFAAQDIQFDEVFICPHRADDGCECRKPRSGLLTKYLSTHTLDSSFWTFIPSVALRIIWFFRLVTVKSALTRVAPCPSTVKVLSSFCGFALLMNTSFQNATFANDSASVMSYTRQQQSAPR